MALSSNAPLSTWPAPAASPATTRSLLLLFLGIPIPIITLIAPFVH